MSASGLCRFDHMGSDLVPEVIFVVVNGIVEFLFGVHAIFPHVLGSFLS